MSDAAAPPPLGGNGLAQDDASLLARMKAGDEQALGVLYDRWHPMVHGVVTRILKSRDDVDDVVEEAFWQAWRQAVRYESSRGTVQTWLLTIARSRALDRVRSLKRLREEPLEGDNGQLLVQQVSAEGNPALDAEAMERRAIIGGALAELPAEQREAARSRSDGPDGVPGGLDRVE